MVSSNLTPVLWLLGSMLLLSKTTVADLVAGPENAVTIRWTPVTLHCSTSRNDSCHWLAKRSLDTVPLTVYNGDKTKMDTSRYFVNTSLPGQCDLTLLQPTLTSPLLYACSGNNGFGKARYASLAVLKSNLACAPNVKLGTTVVNGQIFNYSMYLVYAGDLRLSVYFERSTTTAEKICGDAKKDGHTWRLECDYSVTMNETHRPTFFAAVSDVAHVEGIEMDKTLPTERFNCFSGGLFQFRPSFVDNVSNTETQNTTAVSVVATDKEMSCSDSLLTWALFIVLVCILLSVLVATFSVIILLCRCRRTPNNSREMQQLNSENQPMNFDSSLGSHSIS